MRTPSQAMIRKSSSSPSVVSCAAGLGEEARASSSRRARTVVYGEPTMHDFIAESPRDRVTARTPAHELDKEFAPKT
jgi:hypothetical protein